MAKQRKIRCTAVPLYRCTAVPLYRCTAVPLNNDTLVPPTTSRETGLDVKNGILSINALKNIRGIMPIIFYVKVFLKKN